MTDEVLLTSEGAVGRIRLNRPKALHALTHTVCAAINPQLLAWASDPAVKLVMIDHTEGRGFCAGGDIRMLADSAAQDGKAARAFFFEEYRMNHQLFTYAKPIVAFMDGITMGGGVGISQPARYRVATENTRLAMPESGIGLFPDVGGGWYLSRLPGQMGKFLALTGAQLRGADCAALGLATHYVASEKLDALKAALVARPDDVEVVLAEFAETAPPAPVLEHQAEIDRLFAADTLEVIRDALAADSSEFAQKQSQILATKSPLTCKVSLEQLRRGAAMTDFADEMRMEYAVGSRIIAYPDFVEGVRAVIVDKDNAPRWNPACAEDISDTTIETIFAPLPASEQWSPL